MAWRGRTGILYCQHLDQQLEWSSTILKTNKKLTRARWNHKERQIESHLSRCQIIQSSTDVEGSCLTGRTVKSPNKNIGANSRLLLG